MSKKILLSIYLIALVLCTFQLSAQVNSNTDVNSMSDQQIQMLVQQASKQGLTMDQAIQLAKTKGATQTQIDQLTQRMKGSAISGTSTEDKEESITNREEYSRKAEIKISDKVKKIFGYQLFNSKNLTFEPSVNIQSADIQA